MHIIVSWINKRIIQGMDSEREKSKMEKKSLINQKEEKHVKKNLRPITLN